MSKFEQLVEDFAATCAGSGVPVSRPVIESGLRERIVAVSAHLGVTEADALREHVSDSWGRAMAEAFCADVAAGVAADAVQADGGTGCSTDLHAGDSAGLGAHLGADLDRDLGAGYEAACDSVMPAVVVGRLVAALGQAQMFAALNADTCTEETSTPELAPAPDVDGEAWFGAAVGPSGRRDRLGDGMAVVADRVDAQAAEATTALGLALWRSGTGQGLQAAEVVVERRVLREARGALAVFAERLEHGGRRMCRCAGPCDEHGTPVLVLAAVRRDIELLDHVIEARPSSAGSIDWAAATDDAEAPATVDPGAPDCLGTGDGLVGSRPALYVVPPPPGTPPST